MVARCVINQVYAPPFRYVLRLLQRGRDYMTFGVLNFCLFLGVLLIIPDILQSKILFQPNPFFFSKTFKGTALSCFYAAFWFVMYFTLLLYLSLFKLINIGPTLSLNPFQCS